MKTTPIAGILAMLLILGLSVGVAAEDGTIDQDLLKQFEKKFESRGDQSALINAVTNNDLRQLSLNRERVIAHDKLLDHKVKSTGIIDQKSSGRCWLFAGVNCLAPKIMKELDLDDFELSESYLAFYDKLEKANLFLETMIAMRDRPVDDRSLNGYLGWMFGDGGWFHYFTDLLDKYGAVPISAMPESKQSMKTGRVNELGKTLLRKYTAELRRMHQQGQSEKDLRARKEEMLADIYRLLVFTYGKPPKEFTFRYETEEDSVKVIAEKHYTPKSFYDELLGDDLPEYVALVNNPAKKMDQLFEMEGSRNIFERSDYTVLNLSADKLAEYTLAALLDSQIVWFACDVGQQNYRDSGIMALDIYDYNNTLGIDFKMSKADRISFQDISPSHAMAITGVDTTNDGQPIKWRVENSWGTKYGDKGIWYMYNDWFKEYALAVVVDKSHLSEDDLDKLKQKPIVIADWEPFFLALRNLK